MIPLPSAVPTALRWIRVPHSRNYELRASDNLVGSLRRPSLWSSRFDAETGNGHWMFRRSGFFCTGAEIVDTASGQVTATFKQGWRGGGWLTFADGQAFQLECHSWWRPVWSVTTTAGPVLQLHARDRSVQVPDGVAVDRTRLSLLMMFCWYRVLQAEEDAASAATVAVLAGT